MSQNSLDEIIAQIPSHSQVAVSALAPRSLYEGLLSKACEIILLDTTLHGVIDPRMIPSSWEHLIIIATDFYGLHPSIEPIQAQCNRLGYKLYLAVEESIASDSKIHERFKEAFKTSKDLTTPAQAGSALMLFLEPHLFCPKEDILEALSLAGIHYTTLKEPLFKDPVLSRQAAQMRIAKEVALSFIAFTAISSMDKAQHLIDTLHAILDQHSLRRCAF